MQRLDLAGEFPALGNASGQPAAAARPGGDGARFDALFNELHRDVVRYIEQGDGQGHGLGSSAEGAAALSPEGAWGRLQAADGVDGADATVSDAQRQAFIDEVLPLARGAGARLGVAPEVLTAQAALETGWGRSPIRAADGRSSHNLFGIKATGWQGAVAQAMTTEVEGGRAVARSEAFRAYASPAQSFDDLAALVGGSARYAGAVNTGADARAYGVALQRGGYATDPAYADKLAKVASSVAALVKGAAR